MFKNAYISEYSFGNEKEYDKILKLNLLSNRTLIIPASTILKTEVGNILTKNIKYLDNGAISIAFGNDIEKLTQYIDKYPQYKIENNIKNLFKHFEQKELYSIYQTKNTIKRFNILMRECAMDKEGLFSDIFRNQKLCNNIINYEGEFNLSQYFEIIEKNILNSLEEQKLKAHATYFYNYFGATSTGSGNTYSLDNAKYFDYIEKGYDKNTEKLIGLNILISSALDFTNGKEDFNSISVLQNLNLIKKLTFNDILEIRENWLHGEIIYRYEQIIDKCVSAYQDAQEENFESAKKHIEHAFELNEKILSEVKTKLEHEILLYKITGIFRFLANTPVIKQLVNLPENIENIKKTTNNVRNVLDFIMQGTTQFASLGGLELQVKNFVDSKMKKFKEAKDVASVTFGVKSPVLEYLKDISKRVEKNIIQEQINLA